MFQVRPEQPGDQPLIREIVGAAFAQPAEADLVDALRRDPTGWLSWGSLLALADGGDAGRPEVVGQFQALVLAGPGGVGLAPRGMAAYPAAFRVL